MYELHKEKGSKIVQNSAKKVRIDHQLPYLNVRCAMYILWLSSLAKIPS